MDAATTLSKATVTHRPLKEQLAEAERLFAETGHLYGVKDLARKRQDPIGYEMVYDALESSTMSAFKTAIAISFSPFLKEAWDGIFGILTPSGDTICTSIGLMTHTLLAGEGVKWAIREGVEGDPGINPGDIFEQNSAMISAMHANDCYTYVPIHHEGELIAWAFGMVHRWDAGQYIYGPMSLAHENRFGTGVQYFFDKVGVNDLLTAEYKRGVRMGNRMPHMWLSDASACAAGGMLIRDTVQNLVRKHGVDYFRDVIREFIEDSRRGVQARVKQQLVPGRYRRRRQMAFFLEGQQEPSLRQRRDWMIALPVEFEIRPDSTFKWSFNGVSRLMPFSMNFGPTGMLALTTLALCTHVSFERNNTGSLSINEIAEPPAGSWANPLPADPFAALMNWSFQLTLHAMAVELISRGFFSRGFWEESLPGGAGVCQNDFSGTSIDGSPFYGQLMDAVGMGLPAQPIRDGVDCGGTSALPITDIGNIEIWEHFAPFYYLGRRLYKDGYGKGKYRGGCNMMPAYLCAYGPVSYQRQENGARSHIPANEGVFGSYPGPVASGLVMKPQVMADRIARQQPLVHGRGGASDPEHVEAGIRRDDIKVESYPVVGGASIEEGSFFDSAASGGAGVGDPIERDPELVLKDLENQLASEWAARKIWGVAVVYDQATRTWREDKEGTAALREAIRAKRRTRGVPFRQWWTQERKRVLGREHMCDALRDSLRGAMDLSPAYAAEVRDFWRLPADFSF